MPRQLTTRTTLAEHESEIFFTRAGLGADPDAVDFLPRTDHWMDAVDTVAKAQRKAREFVAITDAQRAVANARLDGHTAKFGNELDLAVDRDRAGGRFKRFFGTQTIKGFCRQAFPRQVALVLAWAEIVDDVFDRHKEQILRWARAGRAALDETAKTATVRGEAAIAEERLAEDMTRERDALHAELVTRAKERHLPREWPDTFFRVETRSSSQAADTPVTEPTPS